MLADNSFPLRSKDAYSDRLMKVSYSRRGGLLRLTSGRAATSRTSFLHREGVAGKFGHRSTDGRQVMRAGPARLERSSSGFDPRALFS